MRAACRHPSSKPRAPYEFLRRSRAQRRRARLGRPRVAAARRPAFPRLPISLSATRTGPPRRGGEGRVRARRAVPQNMVSRSQRLEIVRTAAIVLSPGTRCPSFNGRSTSLGSVGRSIGHLPGQSHPRAELDVIHSDQMSHPDRPTLSPGRCGCRQRQRGGQGHVLADAFLRPAVLS